MIDQARDRGKKKGGEKEGKKRRRGRGRKGQEGVEGHGVVGGSSGKESDPQTLYYTEGEWVGRERGNV